VETIKPDVNPDTEQKVKSNIIMINKEIVDDLLNQIYKKTEISMAIINNKNKCRSELNEIKKMIKNFAETYKK
jgi:ArsR family metal-binding transcriptional regulator